MRGSWRGGGAVTGPADTTGRCIRLAFVLPEQQPIACPSRAAMSGSLRSSDWHERRLPARRAPVERDSGPDEGSCRLCCRRWICPEGRQGPGSSAEHREAPPRRPASSFGPFDRAADLRRSGRGMARRPEPRAWVSATPSTTRRLNDAPEVQRRVASCRPRPKASRHQAVEVAFSKPSRIRSRPYSNSST